MGILKNEIGNKYNRLLVVRQEQSRNGRAAWLCKCGCGNNIIVVGRLLRNGTTRSCGCLAREILIKRNKSEKQRMAVKQQRESEKGIKKHSEETRRKMSETRKGKNNPNWRGGISDSRIYPEYNEWRLSVFERDTFTCQKCGDNKGGNLIAHHIESYNSNPNLRIEVSNGITLCEKCHKNFHHQYGYGDNTRKQIEKFMS